MYFLCGNVLSHDTLNLVKRETQILECQNTVQMRHLLCTVIAVAGEAIGVCGLQQTDFVVVAALKPVPIVKIHQQ